MVLIDTILPFVGVLLGLVVLHELGHFIAAKLAGVRVEEFGIGLPPRIGKGWQFGETLYSFNWLPIGGFVRLTGEEASGLLITAVDQDSRMKEHFVAGDRILKVNGKRVVTPDQFLDRVFRTHGEEKREFTFDHVETDGRKTTWTLTLTAQEDENAEIPAARNLITTEEQRTQFINDRGEAHILGLTVGIDPRSLGAKSRLTRITILAAGAIVNAVLPIILFAVGALIPTTSPPDPPSSPAPSSTPPHTRPVSAPATASSPSTENQSRTLANSPAPSSSTSARPSSSPSSAPRPHRSPPAEPHRNPNASTSRSTPGSRPSP